MTAKLACLHLQVQASAQLIVLWWGFPSVPVIIVIKAKRGLGVA